MELWKKLILVKYVDNLLIMLYTTLMSQTYQPNKRKRAKTHGFLSRSKTKNGKNVILSRIRKGRAKLTVSS